ncbi:hypothetical protein D3C75_1238800 [compost metagenome]
MFSQTDSSLKVKEIFSNYSPQRANIVAEMIGNITNTYTLHHVALHFDEVRHCQKRYFDIPQGKEISSMSASISASYTGGEHRF